MKILITGVNGYIGRWLNRHLVENGYDVYGTDLPADLLQPGLFDSMVKAIKPDQIVHLAAQIGRVFSEEDISRTIRRNVELAAIVAKVAAKHDARLVYVSSSEVYGPGEEIRYSDSPTNPINLYGLTKLQGEQVSRLYAPENLAIPRLNMPYGLDQQSGVGKGRAAIHNFLWWAHHKMPIIVHRNTTRSWTYITDTVEAIELIIKNEGGGVYNVGQTGEERTMEYVAELALHSAPGSEIRLINPTPDITPYKRLDESELIALGWEPKVSLALGMAKTYKVAKRFDSDGVYR